MALKLKITEVKDNDTTVGLRLVQRRPQEPKGENNMSCERFEILERINRLTEVALEFHGKYLGEVAEDATISAAFDLSELKDEEEETEKEAEAAGPFVIQVKIGNTWERSFNFGLNTYETEGEAYDALRSGEPEPSREYRVTQI